MKYYTSGHSLSHAKFHRTGEYETMEEALLGLHKTSETFEFAYLCNAETHATIAYLYHGLHDKKSRGIKFHFDALQCLVEVKEAYNSDK